MSSSVTKLINAYLDFEFDNQLRSNQRWHEQEVHLPAVKRETVFITLHKPRTAEENQLHKAPGNTLQLRGSFAATLHSLPCFQATIVLKGETTTMEMN